MPLASSALTQHRIRWGMDVVLGDEVGSDSAGEDAEGGPTEVNEDLVMGGTCGLEGILRGRRF